MDVLKQMCATEDCPNLIPAQVGPGLCHSCAKPRVTKREAMMDYFGLSSEEATAFLEDAGDDPDEEASA